MPASSSSAAACRRAAPGAVGSMPRQLIAAAHCPVVTVPAGQVLDPESETGHIVVAVDDGYRRENQIAFAFEEAARHGMPVEILHAEAGDTEPDWPERLLHETALARDIRPWLRLSVNVLDAPLDQAVATTCESGDLLVLGQHHLHVVTSTLGSRIESALEAAPCAVAVVREASRRSPARIRPPRGGNQTFSRCGNSLAPEDNPTAKGQRVMKSIMWFEEVGLVDVEAVGGKGANLGELTQAELPVPPGFVITSGAYLDAIGRSGARDRLGKILESLDSTDSASLAAAAEECRVAIHDTPIPADLASRDHGRVPQARHQPLGRRAVLGHQRGRRRHLVRRHERVVHQRRAASRICCSASWTAGRRCSASGSSPTAPRRTSPTSRPSP